MTTHIKQISSRIASTIFIVAILVSNISIAAAQQDTSQTYSASGDATYTLLEPLPCLNDGTQNCEGTVVTEVKFSDYVRYAFNLIIAISAVAAVLVLVWGGFKYVTTDSLTGKSEGRKIIEEALKGLLLVLCSFLILRTIDPRLVEIPATIVKPLENVSYISARSFFTTVSNTISAATRKATEQQKSFETEAEQAAKNLEPLDQKLKSLVEIIQKNPNSPEAERARTQLRAIANSKEYMDNYYTSQVSGAKSVLRKDLVILFELASKATDDKNTFDVNQEFKAALGRVDYNEDRLLKGVESADRWQNIRIAITDEANYVRGMTHIYYINYALARASMNADEAQPIFNSRIDSASEVISKISDKTLQAEVRSELERVRRLVNARYPAK